VPISGSTVGITHSPALPGPGLPAPFPETIQQVASYLDGPRLLCPWHRNLMLLGKFDQLRARREVPFTPGANHFTSLEGLIG